MSRPTDQTPDSFLLLTTHQLQIKKKIISEISNRDANIIDCTATHVSKAKLTSFLRFYLSDSFI